MSVPASIGDYAVTVEPIETIEEKAHRAIKEGGSVIWAAHFIDGRLHLAASDEAPLVIANSFFENLLKNPQRKRRAAAVTAIAIPLFGLTVLALISEKQLYR